MQPELRTTDTDSEQVPRYKSTYTGMGRDLYNKVALLYNIGNIANTL